jgi:hypothetical protein
LALCHFFSDLSHIFQTILKTRISLITFIPSIIIDVSEVEDDSREITPSEPTFSIVSAIKFPTYSSFPAEIEATAARRRNSKF